MQKFANVDFLINWSSLQNFTSDRFLNTLGIADDLIRRFPKK